MNKKYLKENNLYEAHKQFMRLTLNEWSYVPKSLEEDDDENNMDMGQDDSNMANGNNPNTTNMDMGGNEMPDASNNDMNPSNDMPSDDFSMDDSVPMDDDSVEFDDSIEEVPMDDEEVIDVDDLTNAQEEVNDKVNVVGQELGQVDGKIASLMSALDSMEQLISNNNNQIQSLKKEFEKRNPTQTEKLNLRSLDSYPFNVRPDDYWKSKGIDSNYSAYSDNDESTTQEYEITNSDVDDFNEREIADSFYVDDDLNQDLKKIFGL
jgi:hypothetical protein